MGLKEGFVQKAWSLPGGSMGYFLCHTIPHQMSMVGKEGQMEWKSIMEKICASSGFCMSVGLSEMLSIYSSCCHEETVLTFTIFNI